MGGFKQIIWDSTDFHGQLNEGPTEGLDGSVSRGEADVRIYKKLARRLDF